MSDVDGFDYFFTATCNDSRNFGVRRVRQAVHEVYGHEGAKVQRALQSYCAIMCRCWERTTPGAFSDARAYPRAEYKNDWVQDSRPPVACSKSTLRIPICCVLLPELTLTTRRSHVTRRTLRVLTPANIHGSPNLCFSVSLVVVLSVFVVGGRQTFRSQNRSNSVIRPGCL